MGELRDLLEAGLDDDATGNGHPHYPGAVAMVLQDGEVLDHVAVGDAVRYATGPDGPEPLPADEREPMHPDTVFDIASLSKLFTAVTTLALVDEGLVTLDSAVAPTIPEWADDQRGQITLRQLLTHTSGLSGGRAVWQHPTQARRIAAVFESPLARMPGTGFEYSCLDYVVVGLLLERVTGSRLPVLVDDAILRPLRMRDTAYRPHRDLVARSAATEYQPHTGRGVVRGEVHDETNWALGGTAGNAGLFSTAGDLARFAEMLRRDGELDGERVLSVGSATALRTDQLPFGIDPGYRHGLGPRIADRSFMGPLADRQAYGHTGFTGTSLVVTPSLQTVTILLTNRVHPSREWSEISGVRRQVAELTTALAS